jgi:hypothetical protein
MRQTAMRDRRLWFTTAVITALLGVLAGAASASAAPPLPSQDPFYEYSGPLAGVAPGTVLRSRTVTIAENGGPTPITATQVLYRTEDQLGNPSATVATVLRPGGAPSATPSVAPVHLVAYQTAYDALGPQCDPSYTLQGGNSSYSTAQDEEQIILGYVSDGDAVVVPDYEGENLDWAAGQESGADTLDAIRAAEHVLGAPAASTPVGMVGYSGGSIATEFASEMAPHYAPELHIVGVAEGGIPVDFFHNLNYINGSPSWSGVIPAVLVSLARAFHVSFTSYLSPYGRQVTNQVKAECINDFVGNYPGLTIQKLLKPQYANYLTLPDLVRIGNDLIMSRTGTPVGPLFMGVGNQDGTGDGVMVANDVEALAHTYCTRGVSVSLNVYSGDDHTQAAVPFEAGALQFLSQRLNGQAVPDGCASVGPGNSLAPASGASATSQPTVRRRRARPVRLHLHSYGRVRRLRGLDVKLWATGGTLHGLTVTITRGRVRVRRLRIGRLTGRRDRIIVRLHRRMPPAGRYRLTVRQGRRTLLARTLRVR